jgi:hypothetical protein
MSDTASPNHPLFQFLAPLTTIIVEMNKTLPGRLLINGIVIGILIGLFRIVLRGEEFTDLLKGVVREFLSFLRGGTRREKFNAFVIAFQFVIILINSPTILSQFGVGLPDSGNPFLNGALFITTAVTAIVSVRLTR